MVVEKKFFFLCCLGGKRAENNQTDQIDVYEATPASNQPTLAPLAAFNYGQDNGDSNEPLPSSSTNNNSTSTKRRLFDFSWRRNRNRKLPQIPPKSVTFSRVHDIPHIDDPISTYESIDLGSDAVYSKVDDRQRYDYPMFPPRQNSRRRNMEENLYTSASQTYSVGSEDPYSSIASVCDHRAANDDNSVGYARVNEESRQKAANIDDLYAKVNRKAVLERRTQNGLLPAISSNGIRNLQQIQPSTSSNLMIEADECIYQLDESGSGSITSSGSFNPSYRYLTVRETLGAIRERIRRKNEESNYPTDVTSSSAKEHYYSTIKNDQNDYESVRSDLPAIQPSTSIPTTNFSNSNLLMNELKINTNGHSGQLRPPAPTSPIPQLPCTSRLPASQNRYGTNEGEPPSVSIKTSSHSFRNSICPASNFTAYAPFYQLPPLFPVTPPRIIWSPEGFKITCSTSLTSRPIVVSMANVLRKHESTPNIYMKDVGTSTDDLGKESKQQKSKIPRLINSHRVYSNRLMTKSQECPLTSRKLLKRPPSLDAFIPVGNDYVSLIDMDFSKKDGRGWPFVFDRSL